MPTSNKESIDFGFYPSDFDRASGSIAIETLPNLADKIRDVSGSEYVNGKWMYSPPAQIRDMLSESVKTMPYSKRVFGLPKTHRLSHANSQGPTHLPFLVFCFGFFAGMRMSDVEAGFLDATPIAPGTAHDMVWPSDSLLIGVEYANRFWTSHSANARIEAAMRGAIHSYFLSQTPTLLDYEQFIYLYTALEGCHWINSTVSGLEPRKIPHDKRIKGLCEAFSIPTPSWAELVAPHRHATLHEGLFFDEPLGFHVFGGRHHDTPLGMGTCDYVRSPVNTRQRHRVQVEALT